MKIRTNKIEPGNDEKGPHWAVSVAAWDGGCACEAKLFKFKLYQNPYPTANDIKTEIRKIQNLVVL